MVTENKVIVLAFLAFFLTVPFCRSYGSAGEENINKEGGNMPAAVETLEVKSDVFKSGEIIPRKYTCDGDDISPQLSWTKPPKEAKELVLICDDPDAPMGTFVHWVAYGIPPDTANLSVNVPKKDTAMGFRQGKNNFGKVGYGGPCPPHGSTHRFFFKLYAIDKPTNLKPGVTKEAVMKAIQGHILAQGELIGRYGR
jgi:Raf kinase inhibitor-like YbhB/YbcL family protein